jgi:hypothetical protein
MFSSPNSLFLLGRHSLLQWRLSSFDGGFARVKRIAEPGKQIGRILTNQIPPDRSPKFPGGWEHVPKPYLGIVPQPNRDRQSDLARSSWQLVISESKLHRQLDRARAADAIEGRQAVHHAIDGGS